jgi:dTDP-4-dehydrorhamnose reductase
MKILITGASGRIGFELAERFVKNGDRVICTFLNNPISIEGVEKSIKIDLIDEMSVKETIKKVKPEILIHTAALTNVDLCETNHELADKLNVESTRNIIESCKEFNTKIVYISSSFVFNGTGKVFNEDSEPNPINYYGKTKLEGENIVKNSGLDFLILRTDQPYNWIKPWQKDNNVTRVLKRLEAGEITKEPIDWYNNPTFIPNLVEATLKLVEKNKVGIYHAVGPDFINRYEWALKIAEVFKKDKNLIKPIVSDELNLPAKRPYAKLSNEKIVKDTGIDFVGVEEGMKLMLKSKI